MARTHAGYSFEQTLDLLLAEVGGRVGTKPWQLQQASDAIRIYRDQYRGAKAGADGSPAAQAFVDDAARLERLREQLGELAQMAVEADRPTCKGEDRRRIFRHMGDFALYWTGVYPEILKTRAYRRTRDALIDYFEQGKRSYYLASTYSDTDAQKREAPVLRRLSDEFELCALGLHRARAQLDELGGGSE